MMEREGDLIVVQEIADNEVWIDGRTYWCPAGGGYVRLTSPNYPGTSGKQVCDGLQLRGSTLSCHGERLVSTLLRELPGDRRLLVCERDSAVGPRVRWWGEVPAKEIEDNLTDGWQVDWSNVVDTVSGGQAAPLVLEKESS
jgi:hypothetical protein